jgi:predicted dehydrogenase
LTIHIGLIGAGNISDTHARAAAAIPEVAIAGVYAPTREHAQRLAAAHGSVAYGSLDALLRHRPLDLVIIGSPSGLHAEHGIAAAKHGLHVLVEKPIDVSAARADALIAEAERAGVHLGVIFQDRLKADVQRARALIDDGRLGRPILATAQVKWYRPPQYYAGSRWRGTQALDGGGALINQGVHTVDLLLWLFGPIRRVFGRTAAQLHAIEVEDTAVAVLEFENGALGTIEAATSAYPGYPRRIELTGSQGTIVIDGDRLARVDLNESGGSDGSGASGRSRGPALSEPHQRRVEGSDRLVGGESTGSGGLAAPKLAQGAAREGGAGASPASASSPVVADASAHQRVIEDFIRAIATNSPSCCDGREGRRSVALIEAIYRSSRAGHPAEPA